MEQNDQAPQQAQAAMFVPNASISEPTKRAASKPIYLGLTVSLIAVVLLVSGYLVWRSSQTSFTTNGQRLMSVNMDKGNLTPNEIDVAYNQRVSIIFTATNQATPEQITLPAYAAQTTIAQYSTTNIEFTATMKGTFPIYQLDNGIQHEIGKVVVR